MRNSTSRLGLLAIGGAGILAAVAATVVLHSGTPNAIASDPGFALAAALQQSPEAEAVYFEQCAPCHGIVGEGGVGPALTTSVLSAEERIEFIRLGRGAMPAFGRTLDDATILAVSAVLSRMAATITYDQQCGPCHGPIGEGGVGPPLLSLDTSFDDLRLVIEEGEGAMPAFAPTLTEDQLFGITAFTQELAFIKAGADLYVSLCTACHGASGEGGAGPALAGSDVSAQGLAIAISEGIGTMPGFGSDLTESELHALNSYTRGLIGGVVAAQFPAGAAAELYSQLCAACHGADGQGGAGPAMTGLELSDDELTAIIEQGVGSMPGFADQLEPNGLAALVEFVQTGFGPGDTVGSGAELYAQLCAVCHGADGEGGAGPPLFPLTLAGDDLSSLITSGVGSMPGFADQLDADGVQGLVDHMQALFAAQESTTTTTLQALPTRSGAHLYAAHCARCHAEDGSGGEGPDLRDTGLTLNEVISRIYGGHSGGMPAFEGELSGLDVQEIARYTTTLRPNPLEETSGIPLWAWSLIVSGTVAAGLVATVLMLRFRRERQGLTPED